DVMIAVFYVYRHFSFFFLLIRPPPRSTLFPTRRSSDLRGPKPRDVMDLMMSLEKEAPKAGGRVVSLLGNHEMMNIMGDLRYVTAENYAAYADSNSAERQKSAYQEYVKWRSSHTQLLAELPQPMELTEAEWMARHPIGFIEHREAFSPNGSYGRSEERRVGKE